MKITGHGGPGRGQGRKSNESKDLPKKQQYSTRLSPHIIKIIKEHKLPGSLLIENSIEYYVRNHESNNIKNNS